MRIPHLPIIFLSFALFFQGCSSSAKPGPEPSATHTQANRTVTPRMEDQRQTTVLATSGLGNPTVTPSMTASSAPVMKETSTASMTPTATYTSLPTIDARGILGLIDSNGGCQLPCWWGIEPGITTSEQARTFIKQFATKVEASESGFTEIDGKVRFVIGYWITYPLPGSSNQGELNYYVWDKTVVRISVGPSTAQYRYTLDQLLAKMGKPSRVLIEAQHDAMGFTIPFRLFLYYPNNRFYAGYLIEADEIGKEIRACPGKTAPALIMWAPDYQIESRLAEEMLGPDSRPGLQNLEDATNLSIDEFTEIFSKPGFTDCLESPMRFWENLK